MVVAVVEKTDAFKKRLKFHISCLFCKFDNEKTLFFIMEVKLAFFSYFYNGIIFYSAEPFDCVFNFKFYFNIFIFLSETQIKH